jgi:hypothetical protein
MDFGLSCSSNSLELLPRRKVEINASSEPPLTTVTQMSILRH